VAGLDDYSTARIKIIDLDSERIDTVHSEDLDSGNDGNGIIYYFSISISRDGDKIAYGGSFISEDETVVYTSSTKSSRSFKCPSALLSPDGESLVGERDNNVIVTSLKDGSEEQITHLASAKAAYKADPNSYGNIETLHDLIGWSHDGSRVFYYFGNNGQGSTIDQATSHICAVNIRTHETKQLTSSGKGELDCFLDESADNRHVYYSVSREMDDVNLLRRVNVQSGEVQNIEPAEFGDFNTMFYQVGSLSASPDLLVYECSKKGGRSRDSTIYVMTPDGTKAHKLIDRASHPKWMLKD
jgi:Tol biopolymer transport system component